ncbi:MAG: hypothetical protein NC300_05625 [Bacteroidales bacterium]|nr:ABC transporter permease [Clostridium sp.]MCM1203602.1 hypothetical protein [Bacteroidales bacterium]
MFTLIQRKLQNKKVLNGCLLLGITLFIAVAACTPMFKKGSLNRLLQSKFITYIEQNNEYPAVVGRSGSCKTKENKDMESIEHKIYSYGTSWQKYIGLPTETVETHIWLKGNRMNQQYSKKGGWCNIACMPELGEHTAVLKGESLEQAKTEKKIYPCVLTERRMDELDVVVGEILTFESIKDSGGKPLTVQVAGIIDEKEKTDLYWHKEADEFDRELYVSAASLEEIMAEYGFDTVYYDYYMLFKYSDIHTGNVADVQDYLQQFHEMDGQFVDNFTALLEEYQTDKSSVNTIFWVLELPVFVLLLAFVYMVSGQILAMESGEMAMFKSRGFSRKQIVFIYMCQSGILAGFGIVLGIPSGWLLCKLAASTNAFLEFSGKSTAIYRLTPGMLLYALLAALLTMAFMTFPVIVYSRYSIVQQKSKQAEIKKESAVEKYFIDVILLGISAYLIYNYHRQITTLAWDVLTGKRLDPMVFLNVSLFIFACGLVGIRLIHYLVRFVYYLGKDKWKPHMYASFLQIMRTAGKQKFISVFLVLTIAMGIFNSNMAGTINTNNEQRTRYDIGADVVVAERWLMENFINSSGEADWLYHEPDYERYQGLLADTVKGMTRVIRDDNIKIAGGEKQMEGCSMMAIHSKEFGENVTLQDGVTQEHWYNYLNALAKNPSGVLISANLAEEFNLKVGDSIRYSRYEPVTYKQGETIADCPGVVCGIFDAWPGYGQYSYEYNEKEEMKEKQRYMIVVNYAAEVNTFGTMPYEIWMSLKPGKTVEEVRTYLDEKKIVTDKVVGTEETIQEVRDTAMIQITNGLFTLSFLVTLILCTVGFLIYWVTSMKQRELLFGIYRAMGMSMKEINRMLMNEQIFSSLLAGALAGLTGFGTTMLFAKIVAVVYMPESHNIPLKIFIDVVDMGRLGIVILAMIVLCLMVLRYILRKSNITQAIKMGED